MTQPGKNYPRNNRNTFPFLRDKKSLGKMAQKIPFQQRFFPESERFGKKNSRNSIIFFTV
jgi:hypothetical protein